MNRSFLVTRSCTTSIFIYFSDLAGLSNAVRDFFPPLLEQMRGWGKQGLGSSLSQPHRDLHPERGGVQESWCKEPHWPVGARLHLQPHRGGSPSLRHAHSHSHTNTTVLFWVGEDASQRRRGCRRRVRSAQSSPGLGSAREPRPLQ